MDGSVVHIAHSTHAAHPTTGHARSASLFLRPIGNHGFGGDQEPSY